MKYPFERRFDKIFAVCSSAIVINYFSNRSLNPYVRPKKRALHSWPIPQSPTLYIILSFSSFVLNLSRGYILLFKGARFCVADMLNKRRFVCMGSFGF